MRDLRRCWLSIILFWTVKTSPSVAPPVGCHGTPAGACFSVWMRAHLQNDSNFFFAIAKTLVRPIGSKSNLICGFFLPVRGRRRVLHSSSHMTAGIREKEFAFVGVPFASERHSQGNRNKRESSMATAASCSKFG